MHALYTDTFPYTILEAFALGKPVISFALGGPKELIEDSNAGLLSKPFDLNDMVFKIKSLLQDPNETFSLGVHGRKYVEKLDYQSYVAPLIGIYRKLVK